MEQKNLIIVAASILITAILVGGAVYFLQNSQFDKEKQQLQQQINNLNNQIQQLINQNDEDEDEEASDWQTFNNSTYNYQIKYPKDQVTVSNMNSQDHTVLFQAKNILQNSDGIITAGFQLNARVFERNKELYELHTDGSLAENIEWKNTQFSNYPAAEYQDSYMNQEIHKGLYIKKNNLIYHLNCRENKATESMLCTQILSTFKFTEDADVSDWQTYRNEEYGFEFMLPMSLKSVGTLETDDLLYKKWQAEDKSNLVLEIKNDSINNLGYDFMTDDEVLFIDGCQAVKKCLGDLYIGGFDAYFIPKDDITIVLTFNVIHEDYDKVGDYVTTKFQDEIISTFQFTD